MIRRENFVKKLGGEEIFKSPQAGSLMTYFNRFLKAQELEYLNDTSDSDDDGVDSDEITNIFGSDSD